MPSILNATTSSGLVTSADNSGSLQLATNNGTTAVTIDTSQNVGIGTASPSANTKLDVVSADTSQQYVDALKLKTTNTGDYHPAILFENNRNGISNAFKIVMDSATTSGSAEMVIRTKDSGGTFNNRLILRNNGDLAFNSGYGSVATAYGCRAWVNFNGQGTPAIRASGNVSSLTDNGDGDYTVNFTTAMSDANYSVNLSSSREPSTGGGAFCQNIATNNVTGGAVAPTSSAIRVSINRGSGLGPADVAFICVSVFR
jgi:hypothetical protein